MAVHTVDTEPQVRTRRGGIVADVAAGALAVALVLIATLAITWRHAYSFGRIFAWAPPLFGHWLPRVGWGSPVAILLAVLVIARGPELAARLRGRALYPLTYLAAVVWTLSLALINGWQRGLAGQFTSSDQYLRDVPRVRDDIAGMLSGFTSHILAGQPGNWITQVSGHPPGALLVFVLLDRIGLGGGSWAAIACVAVGCLAAVAVPVTLHVLGRPDAARAAVPFAILFPGAIWLGAAADGLFAGVTSAGVLLLALGARRLAEQRWHALTCLAGGLLLGCGMFLSYGLVLIAPVALAACLLAAGRRFAGPALLAVAGVGIVVVLFAANGFWWLDGYHLVVQRYYQDLGRTRPYDYWVWADLGALVLSAGPVLAPGLRRAVVDSIRARVIAPAAGLALAAAVAVAVADESGMSKAEVERIWLPFAVWLTASAVLLPAASRRWWLGAQALTGLLVAHLVMTNW